MERSITSDQLVLSLEMCGLINSIVYSEYRFDADTYF